MSDTKFTPGPWEDQGEDHFADMPFVRVGKGDRPIADVIPPIDLDDLDDETRANARLIVALPELYEALEPFARWCDEMEADGPRLADEARVSSDITMGDCRRARAALAKARGDA